MIVDWPGAIGFCANVAWAPGGKPDALSVTGDVKFGPWTESTLTV
jgi:hypothetical protein